MSTAILDQRVQEVVALHFDPTAGSPYWIERAARLGLDARRAIRTAADLAVLGPFDRRALVERPMLDFVPQALLARPDDLVLAETGGTLGRPVRCAFTRSEFREAFGDPFAIASAARGFPRGGLWLFAGPTGPHAIGRAARLLARMHGALEPLAVDVDPRWARAQAPGSAGAVAYLEHVVDQALDVLGREPVTVLFTTPPLALAIGAELDSARRGRVLGIHLGGLPLEREARGRIAAAFPAAVVIPAYGNSLAGIFVEAVVPPGGLPDTVDYFAPPGRLGLAAVEVVDGEPVLDRPVAPGMRGRLVLSRVDHACLLPNLVERDVVELVPAPPAVAALGLASPGIRDPWPADRAPIRGVY